MKKETTQQLKGIAILLMLWLHLFSEMDIINAHVYWFLPYFNGKPLCYVMTRVCASCVPIYILLGGYGLTKVYLNCQKAHHDMHCMRRVLALYANLWMVMLLFVPLGCWLNPSLFPGSWLVMAENALGLSWTYNGAWWFLLPYALITVGSAWWIGVIYCRRGWVTIVVCVLLAMLNILIYVSKDSLETATEIGWRVVLALMNMGYMMFMFTLGILAVKHQVIERMKVRLEGCKHFFWRVGGGLLLLCIARIMLGGSALVGLLFAPLFVLLTALLLENKGKVRILAFFGRHSTNMWLVHFFFIKYIFVGQIYQLHYPLLIYGVLVGVSVFVSILVQRLYAPIQRYIRG